MIKFLSIILSVLLCFSLHGKESAQEGFQIRWEAFEKEHGPFAQWNKSDPKVSFDRIFQERLELYFEDAPKGYKWKEMPKSTELYQMARITDDQIPFIFTFAYNAASPKYNASLVTIHGLHFLAMEAPNPKSQTDFFQVLNDCAVTDLVRLTPIYEEKRKRECCTTYWEGRTDIHPATGRPTLHISEDHEIHYFPTDSWENHMGEDPSRVIALVKAVMSSSPLENKRVAVHCRAGIGRTGTFIAAYALIHDIDQQLAQGVALEDLDISIEKVVWELCLQRPFMVSHFDQYKTLHELVSLYLSMQ